MTKFYDWRNEIKKEELENISNIIKENGVVIFPTETVYGMGGNALSEEAIRKIYSIKERPKEKSLNILVKNVSEIEKYAEITNDLERKIINNFMPGPITIILKKKKSNICKLITASNDTIGIRIPDNKIVKNILNMCDVPIAAPSANISGKPSPVKIEDTIKDFKDKVDAFIDGGICKESIPSTIVKVIDGKIEILRKGVISIEDIKNKIM